MPDVVETRLLLGPVPDGVVEAEPEDEVVLL